MKLKSKLYIMKISKEAKIGLFATLVIGLLYWGINFLKGTDIFSRSRVYYASYEQVNGLQPASSVIIKGLKVGVIRSMSYDPSENENVIVELTIDSKYDIPKDSEAKVFSDGLMGGKALKIELGKSTEYLQSGDTLLSAADKDLFDLAGSEFESMKIMATELVETLKLTLTNVNVLLEGNNQSVTETMSNLASISGALNEVVSSEAGSMQEIIRNINHLTATLKDNSSRVDSIIGNVEVFTDSLSQTNLPEMVASLSSTLTELNSTLASVNGGEGTLGHLLKDDALYDSLTMATGNLASLLDDLKANPGRYVQFSVFGKKSKISN